MNDSVLRELVGNLRDRADSIESAASTPDKSFPNFPAAPAAQVAVKYHGDPAGPRDDSDRYCKNCPAGEVSVGNIPASPDAAAGWVIAPMEPTREQLKAARDWSIKAVGRAVGNDYARGCYRSMLAAAPAVVVDEDQS